MGVGGQELEGSADDGQMLRWAGWVHWVRQLTEACCEGRGGDVPWSPLPLLASYLMNAVGMCPVDPQGEAQRLSGGTQEALLRMRVSAIVTAGGQLLSAKG